MYRERNRGEEKKRVQISILKALDVEHKQQTKSEQKEAKHYQ